MTPCERLSDRMPAVARGGQWTAAEAAHLAACDDCSAEWALIRSAQALGTDIAADLAAGLSAHEVTARVLGRVRAERAAVQDRWRGFAMAGLAAAAAVALTIWTWNPERAGRRAPLDVASVDLSLPELDSLRAPELETLLRTMDRASDGPIDLVPVLPNDLDGGELEGVLEALEG
jgi:hypothetical protein